MTQRVSKAIVDACHLLLSGKTERIIAQQLVMYIILMTYYSEQASLRLRRSGGGDRIILNWRRVGLPIILNGPFFYFYFYFYGPGGVFTCHKPMYLASFATLLLAFNEF